MFAIDSLRYLQEKDPVFMWITESATETNIVDNELNIIINEVRTYELDLLVFPEIGMDPMTYFAAFTRMAPVQAMMAGHEDTSGISTIDYFITSASEVDDAQKFYTEKLVRMRGLGTVFVDNFSSFGESALSSSRHVIIERMKYLEYNNFPKASHVYVIGHPLFKLHPRFDEVIVRILLQDRLGLLFIYDANNKTSWQNLFTSRVAGKYSLDMQNRIIFMTVSHDNEVMKVISIAHVLLDPFPGSSYLSSLKALSVGVPVVTMPTLKLCGRMTLALYDMLGDKGLHRNLIVSSVQDFGNLALSLTHKPKLRAEYVADILAKKHLLFDRTHAYEDWFHFIEQVVKPTVLTANVSQIPKNPHLGPVTGWYIER